MKIAHIMSHRPHNGVTSSGSALIRELIARGHEVTLIHRPGSWISKQSFPDSLQMWEMDMGKRLLNYGECRRIRRMLDDWGVDVIHTHGTGADRIGALYYTWWDRPCVAKAAARILHYHWRFHDAVFAPSEYTRDWYVTKRLAAADRVHVLTNFVHDATIPKPNAENRATARDLMGVPQGAFVMGMVGTVNGRKNQSAAFPILRDLRAQGVDAHIAIAGGAGVEIGERVKAAAADAGVGDAVHMLGHREDVMKLLAGFDVALSTSTDEQGSIVVIESMGARLPVVSTPVGMVPRLIVNGQNGHQIDLENIAPVVSYLHQLASDPEFAAAQSANARADFEARFLPGPILTRLESLYQYVIDKRRGLNPPRPPVM